MELGQGSRGAPLSWICLSSVIVNIVLRKLKIATHCRSNEWNTDPLSECHVRGQNSDLYCWVESMPSAEELYETIQAKTKMWEDLLLATGGCLKPKKCFW